jgi:hypothetical protein
MKAPGPDGFIGTFFKSYWDIIKDDMVAALAHFANHRGIALISSTRPTSF